MIVNQQFVRILDFRSLANYPHVENLSPSRDRNTSVNYRMFDVPVS